MTKSTKISYVLIALLLLIVCVMHLATPFITVLFSYFALRKLRFGRRGKTLAVAALEWVLRDPRITSALIGARTVEQLDNSLDALAGPGLGEAEIAEIEGILA